MDQFIDKQYPEDKVIKQLLAIDYYLQHKVKPQNLIIKDLERDQKIKMIEELKLNHHKFRFIILKLSFDFDVFQLENTIKDSPFDLIIQYNGTGKAEIVQGNRKLALAN